MNLSNVDIKKSIKNIRRIARRILVNITYVMLIIAILSLFYMVAHAIYIGEWSNKLLIVSGLFIAFVAFIFEFKAIIPLMFLSLMPVYMSEVIVPLIGEHTFASSQVATFGIYLCVIIQVGAFLFMLGYYFIEKLIIGELRKTLTNFGLDKESVQIIINDFSNKYTSLEEYTKFLLEKIEAPINLFDNNYKEDKNVYIEKLNCFSREIKLQNENLSN